MIPWSEITTIATLIYNQAEKARVNKKQTKRLVEKIRLLMDSVLRAENIVDKIAFQNQQQALKNTLDEALKLINEFQSDNWLYRFGQAGNWEERINDIHQKLTDNAESFGIANQIQGFMNREADQEALAEDMANLQEVLTKILDAENHTTDDLKTIAAILSEFRNYSFQGNQVLLEKLDVLSRQFNAASNTAETEIVVVDEGATVGKLVNRYIDKQFNIEAPSNLSAEARKNAISFFAELDAVIPKRTIKVTVVKKGGHVDDLLNDTIALLSDYKINDQLQGAKQSAHNQSMTSNSTPNLASNNNFSLSSDVPSQAISTTLPTANFWIANRNTFFVAAGVVVLGAAVTFGYRNKK